MTSFPVHVTGHNTRHLESMMSKGCRTATIGPGDVRVRTLARSSLFLGLWPGIAIADDAAPAARPEAETSIFDDAASTLHVGPLKLALFVDAYAAWQTNGAGTRATLTGHRAFSGQGATLRSENGLSLAFLGLDAEYNLGDFGVVANLRFGPAAAIFHYQAQAENDATFAIEHLTQAYVLYRPVERLQLDLGMFISPFGFEALESWKNPNYTISALYVYGQPNWHMGLRATWSVDDALSLTALVINGANNISETQQNGGIEQTPTLGGIVNYQVSPAVTMALGGMAALDSVHNDDGGFDAFLDFVTTTKFGALTCALNADAIMTRGGAPDGTDRYFLGGSLTAGYRISEAFGVAARGEYLHDDANYDGSGTNIWGLVTGTLTLDVEPIPNVPYFIVRWENRWERSNQRIFGKDSRGTADTADDSYRRTWFESVLGVVVTTSP